jgi:hypothetical protein
MQLKRHRRNKALKSTGTCFPKSILKILIPPPIFEKNSYQEIQDTIQIRKANTNFKIFSASNYLNYKINYIFSCSRNTENESWRNVGTEWMNANWWMDECIPWHLKNGSVEILSLICEEVLTTTEIKKKNRVRTNQEEKLERWLVHQALCTYSVRSTPYARSPWL